jgi:hypothetical protein
LSGQLGQVAALFSCSAGRGERKISGTRVDTGSDNGQAGTVFEVVRREFPEFFRLTTIEKYGILQKVALNFLSFVTITLKGISMKTVQFTSWQDGEFFIGFLNDYPDYQTQGLNKEELIGNLKDLLIDFELGQVPYIRKVEELLVA